LSETADGNGASAPDAPHVVGGEEPQNGKTRSRVLFDAGEIDALKH
jgi:hypothetical protein